MNQALGAVKRRPRLMDWLVAVMPFFLFGRVHEIFPWLAPVRPLFLFVIVITLATLLNRGLTKPRLALFWHSMTFKWFAFLLAIMFLSIVMSVYRSASLYKFKEFCVYFGIILVVLNCQVNRRADLTYCLVGIVLSAFVLEVGCYISPIYVEHTRVAANLSYDPNDTALFFIMILALILPSAKHIRVFYRWCLYLFTVMGVGVIILTQSRGGLVAGSVTLSIWGLSKGVKGIARLCLLGFLGLAIVLAVIPSERLERFNSIFNLEDDYNVTAKGGRLDIWENGLVLFMENPILGTGLGTFRVAEGSVNGGSAWRKAHNTYLEIAVELGLPGLIAFLGMIFSAYKLAKPADESDWLGQGMRLSLVSFLAGGMFLSWGYHIVLYFVLTIAMIRERVLAMETPRPAEVPVRDVPVSKETPVLSEGAPLAGRRRYTMRKPK
ncbi:O-antigen ligase family protein [Pseudodesulfovibrio methanolicus]|uniref:O-antigen ligase family protein n=1 Tax=Pseudodesulfovibrio methanolicus TaxID=3126690 RepID=A0ABZ2ITE8_9BACT